MKRFTCSKFRHNFISIQIVLFAILSTIVFTTHASAQWCSNSGRNTTVCDITRRASNVQTVSDGIGGTFMFWDDYRNQLDEWSVQPDIYAQYIGADGHARWSKNGIPINTSSGNQIPVKALSDGAGGAIIVWYSQTDGFTRGFAQRVSNTGDLLWTSSGVQVSDTGANDAFEFSATKDGSGGVIVTWMVYRDGVASGIDLYAQHINADGNTTWTPGGVAVCTVGHDQNYPKIVSDGSNGGIVVWTDFRDEDNGNIGSLYAQHIDADGSLMWRTDGVAVNTWDTGSEVNFSVAEDNNGGALIAWTGFYETHKGTTYAQRISGSGGKLWGVNGVSLSTQDGRLLNIVSDGGDGAVLMWNEFRDDGRSRVIAQKISSTHTLLWGANGLVIADSVKNDEYGSMCANSSDGSFLVSWRDLPSTSHPLYIQKINSSGEALWSLPGIVATTNANWDANSVTIGSNDSGGVIATWLSPGYNVMIQKVLSSGVLAGEFNPHTSTPNPPTLVSCSNGATNQPTELSLVWNVSNQTNIYHFQVASDEPFSSLVVDTTVSDTIGLASNLQYSTTYYWRVSAQNEFGPSAWSDTWSFTTVPEGTLQVLVKRGWNLVSVSTTVGDNKTNILYPTAKSSAFEYVAGSGYLRRDNLETGKAYWLRFNGRQKVPVQGSNLAQVNIHVNEGWNLVGSISTSIPASRIIESQPSLFESNFMTFDRGFTMADNIKPGQGYYIKAKTEGDILLTDALAGTEKTSSASVSQVVQQQSSIVIIDAEGNQQTLYYTSPANSEMTRKMEMPPNPPVGTFDVRFSSNKMMEVVGDGNAKGMKINISSATYPLQIQWQAKESVPNAILQVGAQSVVLNSSGMMSVTSPDVEVALTSNPVQFVAKPTQFMLEQNFPNPFNPSTVIRYSIPENGTPNAVSVQLKVYDLLGQEVATLIDGIQDAGFKSVTWNASSFPSGVYVYKLVAGDFVDLKKLVLMK